MELKVKRSVLALLGQLPLSTANCLSRAFHEIEDETLRLIADPVTPGLSTTAVCNHVIVVSIQMNNPDKGAVTDIIYYTP